jgi:hypothetical protein
MWKLKGCPKCMGDLHIEQRQYEYEEQCLQCGFKREYFIDPAAEPEEKKKLVTAAGARTDR